MPATRTGRRIPQPVYADPNEVLYKRLITIVIVFGVISIIYFFLNPMVIVGAGERGVVLTWGAVEDHVWYEGLHFRIPIMQNVQIMDVKTQKYQADATSASRDLQDVMTQVTLNYHIDPGMVHRIYQEIGMAFGDRIIVPAIQEVVKAVTAEFTAEELITRRSQVKTQIDDRLKVRLAEYNIIVETVSITDFQFSAEFSQAIESKVQAEQLALKAENDLARILIEAQQKVAMAQAEATAINLQGEALKENPAVMQLRWIEKWNGIMPKVFSGQNEGYILDISGMV